LEKQKEYDAMTKKIFAPPQAINAEDAAYLSKLQTNKEMKEKKQKTDEKEALESFRMHKNNNDKPTSIISSTLSLPSNIPKKRVLVTVPTVIIKSKRKRSEKESEDTVTSPSKPEIAG
jgi:hypothetical protein